MEEESFQTYRFIRRFLGTLFAQYFQIVSYLVWLIGITKCFPLNISILQHPYFYFPIVTFSITISWWNSKINKIKIRNFVHKYCDGVKKNNRLVISWFETDTFFLFKQIIHSTIFSIFPAHYIINFLLSLFYDIFLKKIMNESLRYRDIKKK